MAMDAQEISRERKRVAQTVLDLVEQRGEEVNKATLLAETGMSRHRLDQLFESEDDIFDAVAALWFEPHVAVMEDVLASDLPSNRKMYEFFSRRFTINQSRYKADPAAFAMICELGAAQFEKVRSFVDLADHYLCEIIAQAQVDGYFAGLEIDETLSLINQIVSNYTVPDSLIYLGDKLTEQKLARIIDTLFIGLSSETGQSSSGVNTLRIAN
jgi:AcrR family transcriptional regulator